MVGPQGEGAVSSNAAPKTHPKSERPLCLTQERGQALGTWLAEQMG